MKWIVGSSIHGCWLGHYEQDKQEIVRRVVKPGMKVFDTGANAGFYTLSTEQNDYLVPTVALDDLLERGTVPIPDVIKMDVEGAEALVLHGARHMLEVGCAVLLIAQHGAEPQRDCVGQLAASSYRVSSLDGQTTLNPDIPCDEIVAWPLTKGSA